MVKKKKEVPTYDVISRTHTNTIPIIETATPVRIAEAKKIAKELKERGVTNVRIRKTHYGDV